MNWFLVRYRGWHAPGPTTKCPLYGMQYSQKALKAHSAADALVQAEVWAKSDDGGAVRSDYQVLSIEPIEHL